MKRGGEVTEESGDSGGLERQLMLTVLPYLLLRPSHTRPTLIPALTVKEGSSGSLASYSRCSNDAGGTAVSVAIAQSRLESSCG